MTLLIGSLQLGFLYGILGLGIYISFRILSIPDLTTEGSFSFGLAVSAAVTAAGHPVLALPAAVAAGAAAGAGAGAAGAAGAAATGAGATGATGATGAAAMGAPPISSTSTI